MPIYECELCNFSTKIKPHFSRHINTAKHKRKYLLSKSNEIVVKKKDDIDQKDQMDIKLKKEESILQQTNIIDTEKIKKTYSNKLNVDKGYFTCELCGRQLSTRGHLTRHIKNNCPEIKNKKETDFFKDMLQEQKQNFENERANLYKQIETLLDKVGNTTNIQSNIKNTITLNNYGNETMSHITDQLKTELVKIPFVMIPKLIEAVHFNDKHPENKNIALTNSRDNKIKIFSDNKWIYKDKEETINDLVDGKYYILDTHYEDVNNTLDNNYRSDFIKFKEYFNNEDKEFCNKLKKECELVLLNNR